MANEVNFIYISGKTLTFSVYKKDGTARETGTALTETPASSGLYLGSPTAIIGGDNVIIKEGTTVVGGGEFPPWIALETTVADADVDGSATDAIFTLTDGSSSNDEYNYMVISLTDISGAVVASRRITDYIGATKKVTVDGAFQFPVADGDRVRIWADTYSQTANAAAITDIVDAVWNETQTDHVTEGTTGFKQNASDRIAR